MAFRNVSALALGAGVSGAGATSAERGCCFSIGFGELMKPCCLETTTDVAVLDCAVGNRLGGATGFSEDRCPSTAQQASQAMQPAVLDANTKDDSAGCCFSIGFGNLMQPCCLQTVPNVTASVCTMGNRDRWGIGGATGFTEGACPDSAEEAHRMMQPVVLEEETQGCCFSIGFGDGMQPCCLETEASVGLSACPMGRRMGGTTGFTEGVCPSTAEEAHESMQRTSSTTNFVESMQSDVGSSSYFSSALVASLIFTVGALATFVVVSYRRRTQDDDVAFVQLDA